MRDNELIYPFNDEEKFNQVQESDKFSIENLETLSWAFKELSALQVKEAEINNLAKKELEIIQRWQTNELNKIEGNALYFKGLIHDYHYRRLLSDPKDKTYQPLWKSKSRIAKPTPEKENEKVLLEHVNKNDLKQYVKESLDWGNFKKNIKVVEVNGVFIAVDENGESIPGVIIKPENTSFTVEVE
jgi:hypothetical protein